MTGDPTGIKVWPDAKAGEMQVITNYPPEISEQRCRLLEAISIERQEMERRIKPYIDELIRLEQFATKTYMVMK